MPTVYVNDTPVEIGTGRLNCIQAADLAGVFIPHYCYHEALSVVASCRMCLVEVGERKPDGTVVMQPKVVPGCQTPVKDGTVIVTGEYDRREPDVQPLNYPADFLRGGQPGERSKKAQADTLDALLGDDVVLARPLGVLGVGPNPVAAVGPGQDHDLFLQQRE